MNQDPSLFSDDDADRASELEDRLRHYRPRAPRLDIEQLERQLAEVDRAEEVGAEVLPTRPANGRRWVLVAAAAWVCGAAAGALVMFLALRHATPDLARGPSAAGVRESVERTSVAPQPDRPSAAVIQPGPSGHEPAPDLLQQSLAQLSSLLDANRVVYGRRPILTAGAYLPGLRDRPREAADDLYDVVERDEDRRSEEPAASLPHEPGMTRDRLLDDLLHSERESIL